MNKNIVKQSRIAFCYFSSTKITGMTPSDDVLIKNADPLDNWAPVS